MRIVLLLVLAYFMGSSLTWANPQVEDFVYDPQTDTYILTFWGKETGTPVFERWILVPHTRIVPTVKSKFGETGKGLLHYSYRLKNGRESKQNLRSINFLASHASQDGQLTPNGWDGGAVPDGVSSEYRVGWFLRGPFGKGLEAGKTQGGFSYSSTDLPGVVEAKLKGAAVPIKSDSPGTSLPNPDSEATRKLEEFKAKDYVPRFIAAPKIPNPDPFNAVTVLTGLRLHLNTDLVSMSLVDPVFASQLDRLLGAALDAARIGNSVAVQDNLRQFRKFLKQEHDDVDSEEEKNFETDDERAEDRGKTGVIDRLAARVLDFDAKYVMKELKKEIDPQN